MVKLLRTDTTLDLSQKARVVRKHRCVGAAYIVTGTRTDQVLVWLELFVLAVHPHKPITFGQFIALMG